MANTFEAVARAWFENWKGPKSERHADYVIRRPEADVFPAVGRKPIGEITAPQLLAMCKKIEARGALDIARRCWQTCGQVFEDALAHGAIERNPTKDIKPSVALKPRSAGALSFFVFHRPWRWQPACRGLWLRRTGQAEERVSTK